MTVTNYHRFESLPVWNYKKHGDPTIEQLHIVGKKRRQVRNRDKQRLRLQTIEQLMVSIATTKRICEAS